MLILFDTHLHVFLCTQSWSLAANLEWDSLGPVLRESCAVGRTADPYTRWTCPHPRSALVCRSGPGPRPPGGREPTTDRSWVATCWRKKYVQKGINCDIRKRRFATLYSLG